MDVIAAYRDVDSYRGAAELCGTTHKTVKRIIEAHEAGLSPGRQVRRRNFDGVKVLVVQRVEQAAGRISAKRLLPQARAAGYAGSARNFRRLVAQAKAEWRQGQHRGRRPGVWAPGETLMIDWGSQGGLHVFCAVSAWSRFRFVRFAADEKAATTLMLLAECFEVLGGAPATVLADRMGCLKAGVVANVVVPTPDYVRFAAHYGFRPDFCEAADPESKGMVEHLVGYAKRDLMIPGEPFGDLAAANAQAAAWCDEVNATAHTEICAVPADRLTVEQPLLRSLPSLRLELGVKPTARKVDKLSCVRFGSARYSVPCRLIGQTVTITATATMISIIEPVTGELLAQHRLVAPGETSIVDDHLRIIPTRSAATSTSTPHRGREGLLGVRPGGRGVLGGSGRGRSVQGGQRVGRDRHLASRARHRRAAGRLASCRRVPSLAGCRHPIHPCCRRRHPTPRPAGEALVLTLPSVPTRSLEAYRIGGDR